MTQYTNPQAALLAAASIKSGDTERLAGEFLAWLNTNTPPGPDTPQHMQPIPGHQHTEEETQRIMADTGECGQTVYHCICRKHPGHTDLHSNLPPNPADEVTWENHPYRP